MVLWSRRQSDAAPVTAVPAPVNVETGWRILSIVNDWTKHAEGKAVAVLASSGVLGSLLYTLVKGTDRLPTAVVFTASVSASLLLLAATCAGIALRPRLRTAGQPTNPLYYDNVARHHPVGAGTIVGDDDLAPRFLHVLADRARWAPIIQQSGIRMDS